MGSMGDREQVHRHSGWLIPAVFFFAILLLSGLFLAWYLRPGPRTQNAPTDRSSLVQVRVRGTGFAIPANYIESSVARGGGDLDSLALSVLFPSWHGYSDADARLFAGNAPDSPVIRLSLRGDQSSLNEEARLERIYMPYIMDPKGSAGPFGLTQYIFAKDSGYERNDLFAGRGAKGLVLLLCEREAADLPSPNCLSVDQTLSRNLSFSWRFKRAYLARWQEISAGVDALIVKFKKS